jgi:hypothetical protein
MDLLDRYLAAIARELPKAQAGDVIAELRDTLLSQIEEREAGLGRKLDRKELEALLKEFGHPLVVAGRYRKMQHLIGPEVFPFWFATLRTVLAVEAAIWLGGTIVGLAASRTPMDQAFQGLTSSLLPFAIFTFGIVTLVFAVMERAGVERLRQSWRPARLPPARVFRRGRFEVATEIIMGGVFLLWWLGLIHFSDLISMPIALKWELAPIWTEVHWIIVAYVLAEMGVNSLELFNPAAVRVNASLALIKNLAGCAIVVYVLQAGHWLQVIAPSLPPEAVAKAQTAFDQGMRLGLVATAFVLAAKAVYSGWRIIRAGGGAPQPSLA